MIAAPLPDPPGLPDLHEPSEIEAMVRTFYGSVAQDDLLGPVFEDVAEVDWAEHLPKLTAFWCRALLGLPGYSGNPFRAHAEVHARSALRAEHFERWLGLFHETVSEGWAGPCADRAHRLVDDVARVHSEQLLGRRWDGAAATPLRLRPAPSP